MLAQAWAPWSAYGAGAKLSRGHEAHIHDFFAVVAVVRQPLHGAKHCQRQLRLPRRRRTACRRRPLQQALCTATTRLLTKGIAQQGASCSLGRHQPDRQLQVVWSEQPQSSSTCLDYCDMLGPFLQPQ